MKQRFNRKTGLGAHWGGPNLEGQSDRWQLVFLWNIEVAFHVVSYVQRVVGSHCPHQYFFGSVLWRRARKWSEAMLAAKVLFKVEVD